MYRGKVRIEVPRVAEAGVFVAKVYRGSDMALLATTSNASRVAAITSAISALSTLVEGDLSLNHIEITTPNTPEIQ
jgi:hypothetical protein